MINFLVPELNDYYSGFQTKQEWRKKCHNLIKDDKKVYLELVRRFKYSCCNNRFYDEKCLYSSYNESYGLWDKSKNKKIFEEIEKL